MMRWGELAQRIDTDTPVVGVEVGVFQGHNARTLLALVPNLFLILVDPWREYAASSAYEMAGGVAPDHSKRWLQSDWDTLFEDCLRELRSFRGRYEIKRMDSADAASTFGAESVDFVFLDGDHTEACVSSDIELWWPICRKFIGGHDYGHTNPKWGVKQAVQGFADRHGLPVEPGDDMTWFIHKR